MSEEQAQSRLSQLRAIDPALLQEVVRQDQRSPDFEITGWSVDHFSDQGIMNENGLFLFRGQGRNESGPQSWSVVLKIVEAPEVEQDLRDVWYWKREVLLAQSSLLATMAGPMVPARTYGTVDHGTTAWIWMEHVTDTAAPHWTLSEYAFAAHEIGRANGEYLVSSPLPDFPWLAQDHARCFATGGQPLQFLEDPLVTRAFDERLRSGVRRLWDERERFFAALHRLPKVFSHGDANRRNLFIRCRNGQDELVAVDWAMVGHHPLGEEISNLVLFTTFLHEWPPKAAADLEAVVYPAYMAGLADGGWSGNPDIVRLGFTAATALTLGASMPVVIVMYGKEEMRELDLRRFGHPPEELIRGWVTLEAYALTLADEARQIMERFGW